MSLAANGSAASTLTVNVAAPPAVSIMPRPRGNWPQTVSRELPLVTAGLALFAALLAFAVILSAAGAPGTRGVCAWWGGGAKDLPWSEKLAMPRVLSRRRELLLGGAKRVVCVPEASPGNLSYPAFGVIPSAAKNLSVRLSRNSLRAWSLSPASLASFAAVLVLAIGLISCGGATTASNGGSTGTSATGATGTSSGGAGTSGGTSGSNGSNSGSTGGPGSSGGLGGSGSGGSGGSGGGTSVTSQIVVQAQSGGAAVTLGTISVTVP